MQDKSGENDGGNPFTVVVDTGAYPIQAIHRALYWLADRASARIEAVDGTLATICVRPKSDVPLDEIEACLFQALSDFSIRLHIECRTNDIRTRIVQAAMAGTIRSKA